MEKYGHVSYDDTMILKLLTSIFLIIIDINVWFVLFINYLSHICIMINDYSFLYLFLLIVAFLISTFKEKTGLSSFRFSYKDKICYHRNKK